jgi:pimeloyl-ACP methyl ester carboxylesterase
VPVVTVDGIPTRYEVTGSGPPLLLFSPGGFDARLENWTTLGRYAGLGLVTALSARYTCICFDRRESGRSGGRVQRLGWPDYVRQATGLLDHLGVPAAHLMGGCVGCSAALAVAVACPGRVISLVLFSPAGGPRYRMTQHARLAAHAAFAAEHGLAAVADRARANGLSFTKDPQAGPWATVLARDPSFAAGYAALGRDWYLALVAATARLLFDRDTVPGAEPEDLMLSGLPALIVPGQDASHAPSAARYLQECLPGAQYWDVPVTAQTAATAPGRVLAFLQEQDA